MTARRTIPIDRCVNGCDAPVQPPSAVLCAACLAALDAKFKLLAAKKSP